MSRYVIAVIVLGAVWRGLMHLRTDAQTSCELCGIVALAHTFYAAGYIAATVRELVLDNATPFTAVCATDALGAGQALRGPLAQFALLELHPVVRVCRNLVVSFLATAQPSTELHRGLNVALTICCVFLSEADASSWADLRVMASVFGALYTYLGLNGMLGASWQREHMVALLEMRRRAQLQMLTVSGPTCRIRNIHLLWEPSARPRTHHAEQQDPFTLGQSRRRFDRVFLPPPWRFPHAGQCIYIYIHT